MVKRVVVKRLNESEWNKVRRATEKETDRFLKQMYKDMDEWNDEEDEKEAERLAKLQCIELGCKRTPTGKCHRCDEPVCKHHRVWVIPEQMLCKPCFEKDPEGE